MPVNTSETTEPPPVAEVDARLEPERFPSVMQPLRQMLDRKLLSLEPLLAALRGRRDAGEKVVFTNGCFDVLHLGHVACIAHCRQFGEVVVVGLNSDASVRAQNKGPDRPIWNQHIRALMLAALEAVDYVVLFEEETPLTLLERIRPDVLVKGADWGVAGVKGRALVESHGGRIELAPFLDEQNTTALINHIRSKGQAE